MAWSDGSLDSSVGVPVRKSKSDQWKGVGGKTLAELTLTDVPAKVVEFVVVLECNSVWSFGLP